MRNVPISDENLTESQRKSVATMRREMVEIADGIKAELEKLCQEQ
jgi:hypothetical protein